MSVPVVAVIQAIVETYGRRYELAHELHPGPDGPAPGPD